MIQKKPIAKNILWVSYYALLRKCPFCVTGSLFKRYLKINEKCPSCAHNFDKADTGDGPAFFVMSLVSLIAVIVLLIVELNYTPDLWVHVIIQSFVITSSSAILLPLVKSLLIHLQYYFNATESYHKL